MDCKRLLAYVRIDGKWTPIGHFGTECKQFELLNLAEEEEDRRRRARLQEIKLMIKQVRRENRQAITKICQSSATANLFDIDLESFCSIKDDNNV